MDDILMSKSMSSIVSNYRLPFIFYANFQLNSKTGDLVLPVSMDMSQLGIIGQRYKIFNDFNHGLNICDLQKQINRNLFDPLSPLSFRVSGGRMPRFVTNLLFY
jgi:hypothetical protein